MNDAMITNNFLNAIHKYAEKQKEEIKNDIEKRKAEELKQVEDESLKEAFELIQAQVAREKLNMTSELAKREQDSRKHIYSMRQQMTEEIFTNAALKLKEYAKTEEYGKALLKSAEKMAEMFKDNPVVLYMSPNDKKYYDQAAGKFYGKAEVKEDRTIEIGGLKCRCDNAKAIADDTMDTALMNQREWFTENSNLKVVL